jgi:hypothetical protein
MQKNTGDQFQMTDQNKAISKTQMMIDNQANNTVVGKRLARAAWDKKSMANYKAEKHGQIKRS